MAKSVKKVAKKAVKKAEKKTVKKAAKKVSPAQAAVRKRFSEVAAITKKLWESGKYKKRSDAVKQANIDYKKGK